MTSAAKNDRHKHESGFTLVELLVSLAVLSMMTALMVSGLSFGTQVWDRSSQRANSLGEVVALQSTMRRAIETIYPKMQGDDFQTRYVDFDGTADRMRFIGPSLDAMPMPGFTRYEVRIAPNGGQEDLVLRWCPLVVCPAEADFVNRARQAVLATDAERVQFRYRTEVEGGADDWRLTWSSQTSLPKAIEAGLVFPEGDKRPWPILVAMPRITQDAACVYDPVSKRCRGR